MFSFLANAMIFLVTVVQKIILLTSYVGQVIVLLITTIVSIIYTSVEKVILFLQIVYEDNKTMFTEEVPSLTNTFLEATTLQVLNIKNAVALLCYEVYSQYITIIYTVQSSLEAIIVVISEFLSLIKTVIVLLGDTFWLVLTFVPVHLPYLLRELMISFKEAIIENVVNFYMFLLRITNFLTDVPLESFLGIILAMIVTRLCITFREVVCLRIIDFYWICVRKVMFLYYYFYNYFIDTEGRVITQIAGGHTVTAREDDVADDIANAADSLCVICQERQKCVLILPCRHVCLCSECCMRLYGYQRTCPICRTFIYHSVTIYL